MILNSNISLEVHLYVTEKYTLSEYTELRCDIRILIVFLWGISVVYERHSDCLISRTGTYRMNSSNVPCVTAKEISETVKSFSRQIL